MTDAATSVKREAPETPGHDVARRSDVDLRRVPAAFDRVGLVNLKQLRVQRTSVELKREFGHFGSDGQHDDESPSVLRIIYRATNDECGAL